MQRTLQALFRERLLLREHLIVEDAVAWLPLWSQQAMLRFEGLQIGRIGDCRLSGAVSYYRSGARPQTVPTASALLGHIANTLARPVSPGDLQRLVEELDNSTDNDVLCLHHRRAWGQRLARELRPQHDRFIAALRNSGIDDPSVLLEQWGTIGHPWHPTAKAKPGLSPAEVVALSPEFHPVLTVPLAAVRRDKAQVAVSAAAGDYSAWFATTFPQAWNDWLAALGRLRQDAAAWLPLPLHPYQARHTIPQKFAAAIAAGDVLLPSGAAIAATPTMSFRTVAPKGTPGLPHIKLPVALQMTSAQRTVSPRSVTMGPRVTELLETILEQESRFGGTLDILGEDVGVHYLDPDGDDDRARHLSVLYRANPMGKAQGALFPVPVGALFADSPFDGRPLVAELVGLSYGDHPEGALAFFEHYARTVLSATLGTYLLYGIALEAHQQNSFMLVNARYEPVRLLARDFGDMRVHAPTLRRAGLDLALYRDHSHPLYEAEQPVRDVLLHSVMICHLAELALLLMRCYGRPEADFWNALRREVEEAFERLRQRTEPQRWSAERRALLEADWPVKSLLSMRLSDSADDIRVAIPTPLQSVRD